jgi:hypothetical protein
MLPRMKAVTRDGTGRYNPQLDLCVTFHPSKNCITNQESRTDSFSSDTDSSFVFPEPLKCCDPLHRLCRSLGVGSLVLVGGSHKNEFREPKRKFIPNYKYAHLCK